MIFYHLLPYTFYAYFKKVNLLQNICNSVLSIIRKLLRHELYINLEKVILSAVCLFLDDTPLNSKNS